MGLIPLAPGAKLKWGSDGFRRFKEKFRGKQRKTGVAGVIRV